MSDSRRLNPHAPPFYPSRSFHPFTHFHRFNPPPYQPLRPPPTPTRTTPIQKKAVRHSLQSVPTGPRVRLRRSSPRRVPPPPPAGGDKIINNIGGTNFRPIFPLNQDEHCTSVMIRNIPNNYTRSLLVEFLENHCKVENEKLAGNGTRSAFDFVYLPIDFKHRLNAGYAFVNFTTSEAAWKFHESLKGKHWDLFQSKKIADVTRARIQGKDALVRNFERMKLCSPSADYLPVWFEPPKDGSKLGSSSPTMKMHTIGEVISRK